jgi:hypothetical protein
MTLVDCCSFEMKNKSAGADSPCSTASLDCISQSSFLAENHIGGVEELAISVRMPAATTSPPAAKKAGNSRDILQDAAVQSQKVSKKRVGKGHNGWDWRRARERKCKSKRVGSQPACGFIKNANNRWYMPDSESTHTLPYSGSNLVKPTPRSRRCMDAAHNGASAAATAHDRALVIPIGHTQHASLPNPLPCRDDIGIIKS